MIVCLILDCVRYVCLISIRYHIKSILLLISNEVFQLDLTLLPKNFGHNVRFSCSAFESQKDSNMPGALKIQQQIKGILIFKLLSLFYFLLLQRLASFGSILSCMKRSCVLVIFYYDPLYRVFRYTFSKSRHFHYLGYFFNSKGVFFFS